MLFSNQRTHQIELPSEDEGGSPATIAYLIQYLCKNVMKDTRKEMFVLDDHV
jgi:ubiquitin related modifier 1